MAASLSTSDSSVASLEAPKPGATVSSLEKEATFPVKLHQILSNADYADVVVWLPHGRSWKVLDRPAFEARVLPLYFRHGRYASFARQVSAWGFRRNTLGGEDYKSHVHEVSFTDP